VGSGGERISRAIESSGRKVGEPGRARRDSSKLQAAVRACQARLTRPERWHRPEIGCNEASLTNRRLSSSMAGCVAKRACQEHRYSASALPYGRACVWATMPRRGRARTRAALLAVCGAPHTAGRARARESRGSEKAKATSPARRPGGQECLESAEVGQSRAHRGGRRASGPSRRARPGSRPYGAKPGHAPTPLTGSVSDSL
jgi:hypothetical protein